MPIRKEMKKMLDIKNVRKTFNKGTITEKVYNALMDYKVEITD